MKSVMKVIGYDRVEIGVGIWVWHGDMAFYDFCRFECGGRGCR